MNPQESSYFRKEITQMKTQSKYHDNFHLKIKYVDESKTKHRRHVFVTMLMTIFMITSALTVSASQSTDEEPEVIIGKVVEPEPESATETYVQKLFGGEELPLDGTEGVAVFAIEEAPVYQYTSDYVNLRSTPEIEDGNVLQILCLGEEVTVLSETGDWSKVSYNKQTGYVLTNLLQDECPDLYRYHISDEEFSVFCRIVEAEVTGDIGWYHGVSDDELYISKIRVAQNILNRVECPDFPDTIMDVVFQYNQYSPVSDGRYWDVSITDLTVRACNAALLITTPDYTDGAIYFRADNGYFPYGDYLFTDSLGISYFGSYACLYHS